jgi:hypothetical protein
MAFSSSSDGGAIVICFCDHGSGERRGAVEYLFYMCHKLNGKNTILHNDG